MPFQSNRDVSMTDLDENPTDEIDALVELHMECEVVKIVSKMGFEKELVRATVHSMLINSKSAKFNSCFELVESVLKLESSTK